MKRLANLLEVGAFLAVSALLIGFFGRWHFALDLACHFRIQAAIVLLAASGLLFLFKRRRWAIVSGAAGLGAAVSLWPFLVPGPGVAAPTHRLVSVNVNTSNLRHDLVVDYILQTDPDFILLQETSSEWIAALRAALADRWPYDKCVPRSDNFGIALFSKIPWEACEVVEYATTMPTPSLDAAFTLPDGTALRLIGTHPLPPMNHDLWTSRNSCFERLAEDVRRQGAGRTIVAGDLNCTPWSYWFKRLLDDAELRNSAERQGLNITWTPFYLQLIGIPIDHALVGADITVARRAVGPYVGSDHRPVLLDFQ